MCPSIAATELVGTLPPSLCERRRMLCPPYGYAPGMIGRKKARGSPKTTGLFHPRIKLMETARAM
ncbi:hypothetical protein AB7M17_001929 [Bradyrhizobium sp. USDA 377]